MKRVVVFSIDGLPFTMLKQLIADKALPNLAAFAQQASLRQINSVYPTVSSAAWTSFITGKQPGKHGLYGFVDRKPDSYETTVPLAGTIRAKNIWEMLSERGLRVFGMNVPVTYPPKEVNGILIADFLCPNLDKVAVSPDVRAFLKSINYEIDSDTSLARKSPDRFLRSLHDTLDKRMQAMFHYLGREHWDYFHAHVMETDRLLHFFPARRAGTDAPFAPQFLGYLQKVDGYFGSLAAALTDDTALVVLSDHGFCPVRTQVNLSRYLVERGWTTPAGAEPLHPLDIDPERSKAYSLIPGRVYLNVRGREPAGIVAPEDYAGLRKKVAQDILALRSSSGEHVIDSVFNRESIYWPDGAAAANPRAAVDEILAADTAFGRGPDLIAVPLDGYDLKMGLGASQVFVRTEIEGMHTFDDAFVMARGVKLPPDRLSIFQLTRHIIAALGVEPPVDMD